jgi:menaquinol-cytochrome c reductase cytochrome b/c subunit
MEKKLNTQGLNHTEKVSTLFKDEPDSQALEHSDEVFYPSFVFKEIVVAMTIFILVVFFLAVVFPAGLEDPADPADANFLPKPEWYFLALYQLQKYFPVKFEVIATFIIPMGSLLLLFLLPFIDRKSETRPRKRPLSMVFLTLGILAILVLTFLGIFSS